MHKRDLEAQIGAWSISMLMILVMFGALVGLIFLLGSIAHADECQAPTQENQSVLEIYRHGKAQPECYSGYAIGARDSFIAVHGKPADGEQITEYVPTKGAKRFFIRRWWGVME